MREYDYSYETDEGELRLGVYRNAFNAYVRWSFDDRSGEMGGMTGDGMLVLDVEEYVRSNGDAETVALPDEAVERIEEDLDEIREEIAQEMTDSELEAFEDDKQVILRAREILAEEGVPTVDVPEEHVFESDGDEVALRAEGREGVAELRIETPVASGYSPMYDLGDGVVSLPADDWGISREIDVPEDVAEKVLDDLQELQEQLNERREAYHDAVRRAREEVLDE